MLFQHDIALLIQSIQASFWCIIHTDVLQKYWIENPIILKVVLREQSILFISNM